MKKIIVLLAVLGLFPFLICAQNGEVVEVETFEVLLSPSKQVPPIIGMDASATAFVEFIITRMPPEDEDGEEVPPEEEDGDVEDVVSAVVDFRVNYNLGAPQVLTAMHIHMGGVGEAGPVVIDSNLGSAISADAGPGRIFRQVEINDPAGVSDVMGILNDPSGYYLNIHSESNPAGLMRGQLRETGVPPPPLTGDLEEKIDQILENTQKIEELQTMIRQIGRRLGLAFE